MLKDHSENILERDNEIEQMRNEIDQKRKKYENEIYTLTNQNNSLEVALTEI